eukprot:COSAG01_NODE_185_length_22691_cov_53.142478_12_plen_41_part_00
MIIYDSVSPLGHIEYQNALTAANEPLFQTCDGIFLNYWSA